MSLEEAIEIVDGYRHLIFKRIRLHLINEFAEGNGALARRVIMDRDLFDDYEYKHEYAMLVGRRLGLLTPEERDTWFGWIDAGPDMSDFDESMQAEGGARSDRRGATKPKAVLAVREAALCARAPGGGTT